MIDYSYANILNGEGVKHDILITDGVITVNGKNYSVSGQTVIIDNAILQAESLQLSQSLCSQGQLVYGSCEAGELTFEIYDNISTVKGKELKAYIIPDSDASKMLQIGVFRVYEDKLSADRTKRNITAYDAMYEVLNSDVAAWYNSELPNSSSSKTLAQFRADFLTHFGITAESTTLANDSITVKRTIEPETLSGADVIRAICEINGVFGTITNEGKFRFVELSPDLDAGLFPADDLYPANDLYPEDVNHSVDVIHHSQYIDVQFEDYNSEGITQLTIRTDDKDVGVTVGTSGNGYVITGNFLVYGFNATNLRTVATNCLAKMENRYYKPCTINAVGNPLHEVGDGLRIRTTYRGIVTYILERKLSGIQSLRDTYSAQGEQKYTEQLNSVSSQFKQLANKTTQVQADVDGFKVTVEEEYVSKDGVLTDLNAKINQSSMTITSTGIDFKSTGAFTVDSSNFRVNSSGDVTIRSVTFDSSNIGIPDMVIEQGVLTAGNTTISGGLVEVGNSSMNANGFNIGNASLTNDLLTLSSIGEINIGGVTLSTNNQGRLLVDGRPVMMSGSGVDITCDGLTAGSIVVSASETTFIDSGGVYTTMLTVNNYSISGTTEVRDINGNTVTVWTVS